MIGVGMEVVQVIDEDGRINWILNGQEQETTQVPAQYGLVEVDPLEQDSFGQQYILLDDNTVVPIGLGGLNNLTFLSQPNDEDSDDNETPPHVLDHMYAKKPREPGTEQVKPPRRRLKKKELITNQYFVQETVPDYQEAPKINIIRQRLPGSSSIAAFPAYRTPPKILHNSRKVAESNPWPAQSFMRGDSVKKFNCPNFSTERRWNPITTKPRNQSIVLQESELPQLGALVTIGGDGNRKSSTGRSQYNISNSSSVGRSPGRKSSSDYRMVPPAYIEVAIPSEIDSLDPDVGGDTDGEVDETELFLDFPMEESEEVSALDVDFSEIPMSTSGSIGHSDGISMSSCLHITPSTSESNLNASHFQKSVTMSDNDNSLRMGPGSSLVIKQESASLSRSGDEEYVTVPQYAPKRKKAASHSSESGSAYLTSSIRTSSSTIKKFKTGERGRPPKSAKSSPVKIAAPPPVVPLRISSRSRRVPNRLDDEDVILSPVKRNKR